MLSDQEAIQKEKKKTQNAKVTYSNVYKCALECWKSLYTNDA